MPIWMWIGNEGVDFNDNPSTTLTQSDLNKIVGYDAVGPTQIKPVEVSGDNSGLDPNQWPEALENEWFPSFNINYGLPTGQPGTLMSYESPNSGSVSGVNMTTAVTGTIRVTTLENNEQVLVGDYPGTIVQMSNGDTFFRPRADLVDQWDDVTSIYSIEILDAAALASNGILSPFVGFNPDIVDVEVLPCFTRGTLIKTIDGEVLIENLRVGDLVATSDNGFQPILWIGSKETPVSNIAGMEKIRPIRIQAGALGAGQPTADLLVSPQHRMLVRSKVAQRMTGALEALVAVKHLVGTKGIEVASDVASVEYFHILFSRHEVIFANGAQAESLYTGPEAIKALPRDSVDEIFLIFPELRSHDYCPTPARTLVSGRMGRQLTGRHISNGKPLVMCEQLIAAE